MTGSNFDSIPSLFAVLASFSPPNSAAVCAKTVLIDLLVASSRDIMPDVSKSFMERLYSALSLHGLKMNCVSDSIFI